MPRSCIWKRDQLGKDAVVRSYGFHLLISLASVALIYFVDITQIKVNAAYFRLV
jgi:hypothetical protein